MSVSLLDCRTGGHEIQVGGEFAVIIACQQYPVNYPRKKRLKPPAAGHSDGYSAVFAPCFIATPPIAIVEFDNKHGAC